MYSVPLSELSYKEISEVGFNEELMSYLITSEVSKDEVVAYMEQFQDVTLDAAIGSVKMNQAKMVEEAPVEEVVVVEEEQKSTVEDSISE